MAICPQVSAQYEERIKTIVLRNSDGINIPKAVREEAYTLAVDIIITSTVREVYKNYTTTPAEGFYGNATLVMQDCLELKVPIYMPRQRIYYGRVPEAFVIWQSLVDWSYFQAHMTAVGETIASLGAALGVASVPEVNCCSLPDRSWIELPLMEVYFNCPEGTQYEIEVAWIRALQIQDACGDIRSPKSKRPDGGKDKGLPPRGTQPNLARDPRDPFAGLVPVTPNSGQGDFSNSKGENASNNPSPLNNVDPSNLPLGTKRWAFLEGDFMTGLGCKVVEFGRVYEISLLDDTVIPFVDSFVITACNERAVQARLIGAYTETNYSFIGGNGFYTLSYMNAVSSPFADYTRDR